MVFLCLLMEKYFYLGIFPGFHNSESRLKKTIYTWELHQGGVLWTTIMHCENFDDLLEHFIYFLA